MKYSLDQKTNRLRIKNRVTTILADGNFRVDPSNNLEFWLNEPLAWRRQYGLPGKISFTGSWKLTSQNDLELVLNTGDRLVLYGKVIDARDKELVFQIASEDKRGCRHVRLLKLSGSWGSDEANRIFFTVSRRTKPDILFLSGRWDINDNQQIVYNFEEQDLVKKKKALSSITFSGYWQITDVNRLAYIFSRGKLSRFDLRAHLETPNIYPKAGVIKYRLGAGVRQRKRGQPAIVCLYGQWRFGRISGLSFDMEYDKKRMHSMRFGASVNVSRKDSVEFGLVNEKGKALGGSLICTHRFLKSHDAEFFVRLKKLKNERSVDAGVTIPF